MKNHASFSLAIAASVFAATTFLTATTQDQTTQQQDPATQQQAAADAAAANDPTAPLFAQMCNKCHDAVRINTRRRGKAEWEDVIQKMIEKGATGSEQDFEQVYEYLLRHWGSLYINSASAFDMTKILGISRTDADAIVAYRTEKGEFADFEAVKKVPNIDVKALEQHKDAVQF